MMLGGAPLGSVALGSVWHDPGAITDPLAAHPFTLELNGVNRTTWFDSDSLTHNETVGQSANVEFVLTNPETRPQSGDQVRLRYYSEVLFAGLIDRIELAPNSRHTKLAFHCSCKDWSVILMRRKLRRNFTNLPLANIIDSLLDNELAGEGFTLGTIDQGTTIPLVDVRNARAFDVMRDVGGATGQSLVVDHEKVIHFLSTTNPTAPKVLHNDTVQSATLIEDVETYRNVQTVIVSGTPANQNDDKHVVLIERSNTDQIAARAAIEGGTGRYEDIEEVIHPTSNAGADLALMGIGYANLRLATSGTPRRIVRVQVRGYGFRAGQFVPVDLPGENASGTWLIQRCTYQSQFGRYLIYELEVTQSSRQQRAYEAWLSIVKAGKVVVQLPSAVTSNLAIFNTPGTTTWTVPAGVTSVEVTCIGGSGSGAGSYPGYTGITGCVWVGADGGPGGYSGRAISIIPVTPGQVLDLTIGAAGVAGANGAYFNPFISGRCFGYPADPTAGASGTVTKALLSGLTKCQGDPGGGGAISTGVGAGVAGSTGGGVGDAVTVGGGKPGGVGGVNATVPQDGQDGLIEIRW